MNYEEQEQLEEWFVKHDRYENPDIVEFKDLKDKPFESEQICAIMFLYGKLKSDEKEQATSFFHGESERIYIGFFSTFEPFTEEEVKRAITFGLSLCDDGDGFEMYASM